MFKLTNRGDSSSTANTAFTGVRRLIVKNSFAEQPTIELSSNAFNGVAYREIDGSDGFMGWYERTVQDRTTPSPNPGTNP